MVRLFCIVTFVFATVCANAADPVPADFPRMEYVCTAIVSIAPIGAADWNLARSDGSSVAEAYYFLRTSDGVVIKAVNRGVLPARKPPQPGATVAPRPAFTSPTFEAPKGKYEWLNDGVFVGTLVPQPGGGAVLIRICKVI